MAKKRQLDFQKTKLKIGKKLPWGRNVTNTTFKAKKITMPSQRRKAKCDFTIQDCIKNARHSGPISPRVNMLNRLNNLIKKEENLKLYLEDIFDNVTKLVLDVEESIRNASLRVLSTVLKLAEELKMYSFLPILINVLTCSMSHTDLNIKRISLKFLDILLMTHPKLVCMSIDILNNLKNLLSGPSSYPKTRKGQQKTNLLISGGGSFYTQDWRIQVLSHMNSFLKAMLENLREEDKSDEEEGDEIYWDGKTPLFIEIFSGGGLKPVDIEKIRPSKFECKHMEEPDEVWTFISNLMNVLSQILLEELSDGKTKDDNLVQQEKINHLNILFEVITHMADWVNVISEKTSFTEPRLKDSFAISLKDQIFHLVKFPFIPQGPVLDSESHDQHQSLPCVRLNLAVCYLYIEFLLQCNDASETLTDDVKIYLKKVLQMSYDIKYESIPTILKIVRCFRSLLTVSDTITEDYMHGILNDLVDVVKIEDDRPNRLLLIKFFMDLSLAYGKEFYIYTNMLECWFPQLIELLQKWAVGNKPVSNKLLRNIQKVANLKHKYFLESLEEINTEQFVALLTHRNDIICETAMFLMSSKKTFTEEFLLAVGRLILSDSAFREIKAHRLIFHLSSRFSDATTSSEERVNFIMFLLNIALDAGNLDERWLEYDLKDFDEEWAPISNTLLYSILPNSEWKTHSDLFKTCKQCLREYSCDIVSRICMGLVNEITEEKKTLPLHFILATFKLNNCLSMNRSMFRHIIGNLEYSTLFFLSVISYVEVDDNWYMWTVDPIMKIMKFDRASLHQFLNKLESDYGLKTLKKSYHVLRILRCFAANCTILQEDAEKILQVLEYLKDTCEESDISQQPLFATVSKIIHSSLDTH